jgi:hypothetical protein
VIRGLHAMFYTPEAAAVREFLRTTLEFPHADAGDGWLIFRVPEAEIGCHPSERVFHEISFYCDDLDATRAELEARGVEFTTGIQDEEWGRLTRFRMPGGIDVQLYEPKYQGPNG